MSAASIGKGVALLAALAVAAGAGYWFGGRRAPVAHDTAAGVTAAPEKGGRKILYYRNPMGLPDT
jgi:Cu(I)/Ag(I) efflux system membrane fusion protein